MQKYIVVENAGYEGETDIREFTSVNAAYRWMKRFYFPDELETLHVVIAREVNGARSYEF